MMKKYYFIIFLLNTCAILISCQSVFYTDLGNHYAWLEDRAIVKITGETGNSLYYDVLIRPQVLNCDYDEEFIIAYQVYDGSEWYDVARTDGENDSLRLQFAELRKIKHCYWIINKETGRILGPLRKNEFEKKCIELKIHAKFYEFQEKKLWNR